MAETQPYPSRDWLTQDGAMALARQLRDYWRARGFIIETEIVDGGTTRSDRVGKQFFVRSNLIDGLPPLECKTAAKWRAA